MKNEMKAVIFDLFNTILTDMQLDFRIGLEQMWKKHFSDVCTFEDMEGYEEEMLKKLREYQSQNLEFAFVRDEVPMYIERFKAKPFEMSEDEEFEFANLIAEEKFLPETKKVLDTLKLQGVPMYVLSNSIFSTNVLKRLLRKYGADTYFTEVWSSADFGKRKPDRSFFEMAVSRVLNDHPGLTKSDIAFIGDSYGYDATGGSGAGLETFWINPEHNENEDNLPVHIIDSISGLLE